MKATLKKDYQIITFKPKFDPAIKKVKVNPGSSVEKTMMGWIPWCYLQVSSKSVHWFQRRKFLMFFTIYGHGGHLGHVTSIM